MVALRVHADTVMRAAEREQGVHFQVSAAFDDRPCDQTALRDANQVDLLAGIVRIVVQLVAHSSGLPIHALKHRCDLAITNLHALDDSLIVDSFRDVVRPLGLWAGVVHTVEQSDGCHCGFGGTA